MKTRICDETINFDPSPEISCKIYPKWAMYIYIYCNIYISCIYIYICVCVWKNEHKSPEKFDFYYPNRIGGSYPHRTITTLLLWGILMGSKHGWLLDVKSLNQIKLPKQVMLPMICQIPSKKSSRPRLHFAEVPRGIRIHGVTVLAAHELKHIW